MKGNRRKLRLDAKQIAKGVRCLETLKPHGKGDRALEIALNLGTLRGIIQRVSEAEQAVSDRCVVRDAHGDPIPAFVPAEQGIVLDFSRFDGPWQAETEYAPGQIVTYADGFFEAERVTDERPPGSTWTRIGSRARGHFVEDPDGFAEEMKQIHEREHELELYTIPESLMRHKDITGDMVWPEIIEFDVEESEAADETSDAEAA